MFLRRDARAARGNTNNRVINTVYLGFNGFFNTNVLIVRLQERYEQIPHRLGTFHTAHRGHRQLRCQRQRVAVARAEPRRILGVLRSDRFRITISFIIIIISNHFYRVTVIRVRRLKRLRVLLT